MLGATGKTGQLILERLLANNARPVLVGRNRKVLQALADVSEKLEIAVADVQDEDSLRAVIRPGDILISTVGPFATYGKIPLAVAVERGAHYIDTSGEPDFTDHVYETFEKDFAASQQVIMTSCGFDYVPGQVAAGKLLAQYGDKVATLNVIYATADGRFANLTTGTLKTFARAITEQGTFYNGGTFRKNYFGAESYPITAGDRSIKGIKIPTVECREHIKSYPRLQNVNIYLAWFGYFGGIMAGYNKLQHLLYRIPGYRRLIGAILRKLPIPQRQSADIVAKDKGPTLIRAEAYDQNGRHLGTCSLEGHNIYYYTGQITAWTAIQLQSGHQINYGITCPLRAFGLNALAQCHNEFGFHILE